MLIVSLLQSFSRFVFSSLIRVVFRFFGVFNGSMGKGENRNFVLTNRTVVFSSKNRTKYGKIVLVGMSARVTKKYDSSSMSNILYQ